MEAPTRKKPGPAARITRRKVVEIARRLHADSNLTMTAISEELGVSIGALYRYVPDKAGVLGLLTLEDRDTIEPPDASLSWREWLESAIRTEREFWNHHPELQSVAGLAEVSRPGHRTLKDGLEVLTREGFSPLDALTALTTASQIAFGLSMIDRMGQDHHDPQVAVDTRAVLDSFGIQQGWLAIGDEVITLVLDGIATRLQNSTRRWFP